MDAERITERLARLRQLREELMGNAEECLHFYQFEECELWLKRAEVLEGKILTLTEPPLARHIQRSSREEAIHSLRVFTRLARRTYRRRAVPGMRRHCAEVLSTAKQIRRLVGQHNFVDAVDVAG